ncbi:MAG: ABC transporter permease [Myxococcaceae bacterium]|nr:ABC transporter permease [Myxococcaceae bacterium]MBH2006595.1 ABC transporter permease [Myxococcaceae bacterium]
MKVLGIRFLQMGLILAALSVFLFVLMLKMPGNPVDLLITSNPRIKAEDVIRLKKLKGLDQPWYVQYLRWMWGYYEPLKAPMLGSTLPQNAHVLFGGQLSGGRVWYVVKNESGLESVGTIWKKQHPVSKVGVLPIPSQVMDVPKHFTLDLNRFVMGGDEKLHFELIHGSPGMLDSSGVYTWPERGRGQKAIQFSVRNKIGDQAFGAFSVERDPMPNLKIFNRGFIFVLLGDTQAMGFSNTYKRPVWELLKGRVANTLALMIPAILLSLLIALPLGIYTARRQYSWSDYGLNFLAFIGISLPVFWFGILIMYIFAERLQWFPAGGILTPGVEKDELWNQLVNRFSHAVLPVCVLSIAYAGRWLRYMRASMLEILPSDYIRTARAKGLSENKVIFKHALRNALIPIVTLLALSIPVLFGGAVLTETVFSWPGMGRLQYDAILNSDYYVAIVVFLISAFWVMVGNLLADGLYRWVDPRMRNS